MTRRRLILTGLIAIIVVATGLLYIGRVLRGPGAISETRGELLELRIAVDSCQAALAAGQQELLAYNEWLDSLRSRVREFEALDPRGVPADSYSVYIDAFSAYNDSVATWEGRVAELQAERDACADLIAAHNQTQDSLRTLLDQQRR